MNNTKHQERYSTFAVYSLYYIKDGTIYREGSWQDIRDALQTLHDIGGYREAVKDLILSWYEDKNKLKNGYNETIAAFKVNGVIYAIDVSYRTFDMEQINKEEFVDLT